MSSQMVLQAFGVCLVITESYFSNLIRGSARHNFSGEFVLADHTLSITDGFLLSF